MGGARGGDGAGEGDGEGVGDGYGWFVALETTVLETSLHLELDSCPGREPLPFDFCLELEFFLEELNCFLRFLSFPIEVLGVGILGTLGGLLTDFPLPAADLLLTAGSLSVTVPGVLYNLLAPISLYLKAPLSFIVWSMCDR